MNGGYKFIMKCELGHLFIGNSENVREREGGRAGGGKGGRAK